MPYRCCGPQGGRDAADSSMAGAASRLTGRSRPVLPMLSGAPALRANRGGSAAAFHPHFGEISPGFRRCCTALSARDFSTRFRKLSARRHRCCDAAAPAPCFRPARSA
ncbi:hypothetical protein PSP6_370005 [Paraburkholderia tropica]|nr:hypothetical protein PSP6_370005 [Paraburkholderia tropica]